MSDIAKNIKRLRQRKNLTQEELAEKLFVTRQAVSNWETGKNQPDIEMLQKLSEVLEADVKELLYGPPPDEWKRKRALVAVILCVLALGAWSLYFFLFRWAKGEASNHFNVWPVYLCQVYLKPLAYLLLGAAVPAVFSVPQGLLIKNKNLRRIMAGVSILYCAVFWALGMVVVNSNPVAELIPRTLRRFYSFAWCKEAWTFLFPGVLLFCSWPRKAG